MLLTVLVSTAALQGLVVPYGLLSTEEASVANLSTQHLSHPGTVDMSGDMADLTPGCQSQAGPFWGGDILVSTPGTLMVPMFPKEENSHTLNTVVV